jgi:hypothetical protein
LGSIPKKTAKQTAFRAWKKAKPSAELHKRILEAVEAAKRSDKWLRDNGRYVPNPATWLNGGCWDDVITPTASRTATEKTSGSTSAGFNPSGMSGFRNALDRYDDDGNEIR